MELRLQGQNSDLRKIKERKSNFAQIGFVSLWHIAQEKSLHEQA